MRTKVQFDSNENRLAGLLERPSGAVRAYVLFAHCFTCGKDIAAASRISRALVQKGYGVLRFDFTGLGNSDGDFANADFSSNLQDLRAAADFLRRHYSAPQLLIGHSLGGTAVLAIADEIPEVNAVVSIAAPAQANSLISHFAEQLQQILQDGHAKVKIGGREFTITRAFIDDLAHHAERGFKLTDKALLLMHSPHDKIVSISEAEQLYLKARHPKSFISLDKADHLLSDRQDAQYAADAIAGWAEKYVKSGSQIASVDSTKTQTGKVVVEERDHKLTQTVTSDTHQWLADEPFDVGGKNLGPDPYEHLLAALGACTSMTLRMYADHKGLKLDNIKVTLSHQKNHFADCNDCDNNESIERIERNIEVRGDLTEAQRQRLHEIADKCPVHRTLQGPLKVDTTLAKENR